MGMYQWSHLAILGRENSSTSGEFSMSHERHIPIPVQVTIFPHEWLSRRGEKKFLHEPRVEEFFFTTTAKPWMGKNCDAHRNWNVPWVTNREFPVPKLPNDFISIPKMKVKTRKSYQFGYLIDEFWDCRMEHNKFNSSKNVLGGIGIP